MFCSASIYYYVLYGDMDKFKEEVFEEYNGWWQLKYIKN